ncbi:Histone-lysine N-methyltransferase PRDM9 [Aphelenchoides avenae]|nr:Histone-lysine N-methyltransferase PRDM9 [Aphelenchus avenae]
MSDSEETVSSDAPGDDVSGTSGRRRQPKTTYSCTECDYTTPYGQVLQRHMRSHTGLKPFKCDVCPKSFALKQTLDRHLRIHFGEKPYKCSTCDYASTFLGNLQQHEKTHSPKDLKCPYCPMKFSLPCTLKRHMQLHAGRTHACDRCGHKTQTQHAMDSHKRNSACAGEPKHKCEHCSYSTNDAHLLREHMKRRAANGGRCPRKGSLVRTTYYVCPTCRFTTSSNPLYEKHMARREGDSCPKNKRGRPRKNPETTADYERVKARFNFVDAKQEPGSSTARTPAAHKKEIADTSDA